MTTHTGAWIRKGWHLFIANFWLFLFLGFIFTVIIFALYQSQDLIFGKPHFSTEDYKTINPWIIWREMWKGLVLSDLVNIFFGYPLTAGLYAVTLNLLKTGQFQLDRLRVGLEMYPQIVLATLIISLFSLLGIFFCFLPTILVQLFYSFTLFLIIDRKLYSWPAMEESRKQVQQLFWGMLGFFLALGCIGLITALPGLMLRHLFPDFPRMLSYYLSVPFFAPFSWCIIAVAYRDLWPEPEAATETSELIAS